MSPVHLHICITCGSEQCANTPGANTPGAAPGGTAPQSAAPQSTESQGAQLLARISQELENKGLAGQVLTKPVQCLGNCAQGIRASIAGTGRWSWVLGGLRPEDASGELIRFIKTWLDAEAGLIPREQRSDWIKAHSLGRVPPVEP